MYARGRMNPIHINPTLMRIAKAIKSADAHGYPCSTDAMRLIKSDIAEALYDDARPNGGPEEWELFLIECGLTKRDGE